MKEEETRQFEEELKFIEEFISKEKDIEDENQTTQYFNSIRSDEFLSCALALISICSGIVYYELKTEGPNWDNVDRDVLEMATQVSIYLVSVSVGLFLIALMFKYINYLRLYRSAKYCGFKDGLIQTGLCKYCVIELVIAIIHPNRGFHEMKYVTDKSWNLYEVEYGINDFLILILLCRTVYLIKTIVVTSKFYGGRADRVTKLMGNRLTFFFSFKCMVIKYPFRVLTSLVLIVSFTLAYIMKIIEGPLYYKFYNGSNVVLNDYRSFANCMWNMLITITTVGYGDYYPNSVLGRLVIVLTAFVGIILLSLVISFLQNTVRLTEHEQRAYDFISRLESKENVRSQAVKCFDNTFKYFLEKKRYLKYARGNNVDYKILNDKRAKLLDLAYKKIKNKREFKEILHNFQNVYGAPNDVDLINKKIDELEETMIKGSKHMNLLESRLNSILEHTSNIII